MTWPAFEPQSCHYPNKYRHGFEGGLTLLTFPVESVRFPSSLSARSCLLSLLGFLFVFKLFYTVWTGKVKVV